MPRQRMKMKKYQQKTRFVNAAAITSLPMISNTSAGGVNQITPTVLTSLNENPAYFFGKIPQYPDTIYTA